MHIFQQRYQKVTTDLVGFAQKEAITTSSCHLNLKFPKLYQFVFCLSAFSLF